MSQSANRLGKTVLAHELWLRAVDIRLRLDWLAARLAASGAAASQTTDDHLVAYV